MRYHDLAAAFAIILVVAVLALHSLHPSVCSNLCAYITSRSGDAVALHLDYGGRPITGGSVVVAMAGLKAVITRWNGNSLSLYLPLRFGINWISFSYGASSSSVMVLDLGGYSGFLFVLLGIAIFDLARQLPESGILGERVTIGYEIVPPLQLPERPSSSIIREAIGMATAAKGRQAAISGIPPGLHQISSSLVLISGSSPLTSSEIEERLPLWLESAGYRISRAGAALPAASEDQLAKAALSHSYSGIISGNPLFTLESLRRGHRKISFALAKSEPFFGSAAAKGGRIPLFLPEGLTAPILGRLLLPHGDSPAILLAMLSGTSFVVRC